MVLQNDEIGSCGRILLDFFIVVTTGSNRCLPEQAIKDGLPLFPRTSTPRASEVVDGIAHCDLYLSFTVYSVG
jgi:hypothetical protein